MKKQAIKKIYKDFLGTEKGRYALERALSSISCPLFIIDINDRRILFANPEGSAKIDKIYGQNIRKETNGEIYFSEGPDSCPFKKIKQSKKEEIRKINYKDGRELKSADIHTVPILDNKEKLSFILEYIIDTSREENLKMSLQEDKKELESIFESIGEGVFIKNLKREYVFLNTAAEKYFLKPKSKVLGNSDKDIFPESERKKISAVDKAVLSGETVKEELNSTISGRHIVFSKTKSPLIDSGGKIKGICGVVHDITEDREREHRLNMQNKMNKEVLENSPVGMFVVNSDGYVDYVNKKMIEIANNSYDDFLKINFLKHSTYKKAGLTPKIKKCLSGEGFKMDNVEYISRRGNKKTIRNFIGIPTEDLEEQKALIIVEDITDIKEKENNLKRAAFEWSNTFDSMMSGISIHSTNHKILNANKFLCKLLDTKKEDLIGKKCYEMFHNLKKPIEGCPLQKTIHSKQKESFELHEEKIGKWLFVTTSPVFNKKGQIEKIIHIVDDVSEKKEREQEIKDRNEELERFNDIAVNRELKMIELKEQVKKLKSGQK